MGEGVKGMLTLTFLVVFIREEGVGGTADADVLCWREGVGGSKSGKILLT